MGIWVCSGAVCLRIRLSIINKYTALKNIGEDKVCGLA
jgi:hypothetical protein